jgi:hypothetical protein
MKLILLLLLLILLSGCSNVIGVKPNFPELPPVLTESCPELLTIPENENRMSEFLKVVIMNYDQYYECKYKVEAINEWYIKQKEIYEEIK